MMVLDGASVTNEALLMADASLTALVPTRHAVRAAVEVETR